MTDACCAVCLEKFFPAEAWSHFDGHLRAYVYSQPYAVAEPQGRLIALQSYTTAHRLHRALQRKCPEHWRAQDWQRQADLFLNPVTLACGHALHQRCVTQLIVQSYDPDESATPTTALPFCTLPRVPRVVGGSVRCPVCRRMSDTELESTYDEADVATDTVGPYRLKPGSLVWMYDECWQPGHPECGSLGQLVGRDPDRAHRARVVKWPTQDVVSVSTALVFDLLSLACTGLPSRDRVLAGHVRRQIALPLVEEWVALPESLSLAQSILDHRWIQTLTRRLNYVQQTFAAKSTLQQSIRQYLDQAALHSSLVHSSPDWDPTAVDIDLFWKHKVLPRLGMLGPRAHHLILAATSSPIPFPILEHAARCTGWHQEACVTLLRYAQSGLECNAQSAPSLIRMVRDWQEHPTNATLFRAFRLPPTVESAQPRLTSPSVALGLASEHEEQRLQRYAATQRVLVHRDTVYHLATNAWLLPSLATTRDLESWLSRYGTVLDVATDTVSLEPDVPHPLPYAWLPVAATTVPRIQLSLRALRDNVVARVAAQIDQSTPTSLVRPALEAVRAELLASHHLDVYAVSWLDLPPEVQSRVLARVRVRATDGTRET